MAPVWASYKDANEIFLPGAPKPSGWGVQTLVPPNCSSQDSLQALSVGARKFMNATSESATNAKHRFHLSSGTLASIPDPIMEAAGGWLTDQTGNLVYFERKVGKAEFVVVDLLRSCGTRRSRRAKQRWQTPGRPVAARR